MEYLIENWPNLIFIFLYLMIFLPVIFLNLLVVILTSSTPLLVAFFSLLPKKHSLKIVNKLKIINYHSIGYSFGRFTKNLQDDITDNFPFSLPKKTIIIPIQGRVLNFYSILYRSYLKGFLNGITAGTEIKDSIDSDIEKLYVKIFSRISLIFFSILFFVFVIIISIPLSIPTIIFVYLLYGLI